MELNENIIESCKAIIEAIVREPSQKVRNIKYSDFVHKFDSFILSKEIKVTKKEKVDFIIFTIVPVEFETLNKILNFAPKDAKEDYDINGLWYYKLQIERKHGRQPLNGLVTLVGRAGDINCSLACGRALQKFDCDLAILCGIAAGLKSEITKYSTVISQTIVNYEFQRIDADGITYRPRIFNIDDYNAKLVSRIKLASNEWKEEFLSKYENLIDDKIEFPITLLDKIALKEGTIASGAKLLADGKTLENLRKKIPIEKGIVAAEMEGSGFSPACIEFQKNWLVIRGISDYGEKDKNKRINKKYQKVAAASAGTAMIYYMKNLYRTPKERGEQDMTF